MADIVEVTINDKLYKVDPSCTPPETSLNEFLRNTLHLTGTKYMCLEGGCGACTISANIRNPRTGISETLALKSCLVPILSCYDWEITTIEGLGSRRDGYNETQQKIVQFHGTQCGFCTPGMVMNMQALLDSSQTTMAEIEHAFGGNICRCTGYRPILTAFKSMASDKDEKLLGIIPDLEDLSMCTKQKCEKSCSDNERSHCSRYRELSYDSDLMTKKNWYKVTRLVDLFKIIKFRGADKYKLVAGNTAQGVYKDMATADYYIDIRDVLELRMYALDTNKLVIGANFTLTETIAIFKDVVQRDQSFRHLRTVVDHLNLVATTQIRNAGTIAGNLTIKYVHNEFPSDVFILLEVIGAKLILDNGLTRESVTPANYLLTSMKNKIIRSIEIPPLDSSYRLETYKIMPKTQNAHAEVNAGFLFKFQTGNRIVECASIVYGGINPRFIHASASEGFICGLDLFNNHNMQKLFGILDREINPDNVLPQPSPKFRKQLSIALMYKYILSIAPSELLTATTKSGGQKLVRPPVSKGVQEYKTNMSMYPIGQPINKIEAADQASGEAKFVTDMPDLPYQTYAEFVLGKARPGSVVKSIDPSEALKLDGVIAFFQATDIQELGGVNSFMAPNNKEFYVEDEAIFIPVTQPLRYYYQPVGLIVAETKRLAEKAAALVKVEFTSTAISPVITIRDALKLKETNRIRHQNTHVPTKQDRDAPNKVEGELDLGGQYHYHMEMQVANVIPNDDGGLTIHPNTQWLDGVQYAVSRALNIPANTIEIYQKRLGGGFGAKITRNQHSCCGAALAAYKLNRPVKISIPLTTNMNIIGKRNPTSCNYEVGYFNDGRIGFLDNDIYSDVGCYTNSLVEPYIMDLYNNTFVNETFLTDTFFVITDTPSATFMRAPGSLEGCAIIQSILAHVACQLNVDPINVILANLNSAKHPLLLRLVNDTLAWSDYRNRRTQIDQFNQANRWRKRGIALTPMVFNLAFLTPHQVQISIYMSDGTIAITHGGIDMGQGINTKVAQAAAYLLGVDMKLIKIKPANNFATPNNMLTGGSVTTEGVLLALRTGATNIKKRIDAAAASKNLPATATWLEKVRNAFTSGEILTETAIYNDVPSKSATYAIYGCVVTEIEVDILTGNYIIQRVDLLEDAGDSLNPALDIGQLEGAFVMGTGYLTMEHLVYDQNGALTTNNTWNYKVPGATDIPVDFRVKIPDGIPNPTSPYRNKATTEPATCLAISVPLAIRDALRSARTQADPNANRWTKIDGPTTVEWIFNNTMNDYKQYKL